MKLRTIEVFMCLRWFLGLYSGYTITYFSNSLNVLMLLKKDGSHRKPKGNKIIQFTKHIVLI